MLCWPLLRKEIKSNYKLWLIFCGVLTMYGGVIISMFDPKLGESLALMAESMPQLFAAFGMTNPGATMIEFLVNYLYGFLFLCFPLVLLLILTNRLMVRYLDRGAMAWLLATPHPRWRIALTQAKVLGMAVLGLVVYIVGLCVSLSEMLFPGELDIGRFLLVNLGLFALLTFFAGVCFFSACLFGGGKYALGAGGGLCIAFVLVQMLGQVGEKLDFLRYFTPLTLFDALAIATGDNAALWPLLALYAGAVALFLGGIWVFSRRDMSL